LSLAVVRDLRVARAPVTAEDLAALQTDVLAGFVLARAAAGLSDGTIASDVLHLEQVRAWFGRPLWEGSGNSRVIYHERDGTGRARSPCVGPVGTVALLYPGCRVFVGALQGGANPLVAGVDVLGAHQVGDPSGAELPLDLFTG
jgi:hypothetical protein